MQTINPTPNKIANILMADNDYNFGIIVKKYLEEAGYQVFLCSDGEVAWKTFQKTLYDLCLFDVIIPKKNGFDLVAQIRKRNDLIPLLFFTSKTMDKDRISGFEHGADDYIPKTASMQELILRIEVFLKRTRPLNADKRITFVIGGITFDYGELRLTDRSGKLKASLTQREADLLKYLCENANKRLERSEILLHVWGNDDYYLGRSMDVFITKLRKHFKEEKEVELETIHKFGFKFHVSTL